jgi:hypothetical protein
MSKAHVISLLALGTLLTACAPRTVPLPEAGQVSAASPPPAETARALPTGSEPGTAMPTIGDIEKRRAAYEEKYREWQALAKQLAAGGQESPAPLPQCLRMASSLHDSYSRLREQAAAAPAAAGQPGPPRLDPWEVLRADIVYLESECDAVYQQLSGKLESMPQEQMAPVAKLEVVVGRYVEEQQYEEALVAYRNLERRFPGWQPSFSTRRAYGQALLHSGQLDKAAPVLREVLPHLPPAEQLAAKRLVADLLWATYKHEEAKSLYQSLAYQFGNWKDDERWVADQLALLENLDTRSEEMAAYIALLRIYLTFDGRRLPAGLEGKVAQTAQKFPGSMIAERGRQLLQRATEQSRSWQDRRLAAAEALVAERRFAEARASLKELEQKELPPATGERVRRLIDETLLAETRAQEQERLVQERDLTGRWEEASHLLDLEQYDEASRILTTLLGTDYEPQAKGKLRDAGNRAASEVRRQAATLFVKARESSNPERKLEFLLESRRLLKTIIEKYPEADVIDKVARNLEAIDQQIRQLNPALLLEPPASAVPAGLEAGSR